MRRIFLLLPVVLLVGVILPTAIYGVDTRFASGKSALAIPFELDDNRINNHIFLHGSINGSPPLSFILDTGASHTILSLQRAESFGMRLQPVGKVEGGIGAEPPDAYLVADKVSLSLPGIVIPDQRLVAISLDQAQNCIGRATAGGSGQRVTERKRRMVDGILGKDFFDRFVVEIDYAARLINLYDPASYQYTGKGQSLPLEVEPRYIFVRAQVKPPGRPHVTARLVVDTGSGTALSLTKQFAEAHKLLPPVKQLMATVDCGIGGSAKKKAWVGTLKALQLGGLEVSNPTTIFYQEPTIQSGDGILGNPVLRNFKVIFDYSRSRMILESPRRMKNSK